MARWYERNGFRVIARNWTMRGGEIDVVARRGNLVVVCEVKARRNANHGDPFEAITPRKIARLRRATAAFVAEHRSRSELRFHELRFDGAAVCGSKLEVRQSIL